VTLVYETGADGKRSFSNPFDKGLLGNLNEFFGLGGRVEYVRLFSEPQVVRVGEGGGGGGAVGRRRGGCGGEEGGVRWGVILCIGIKYAVQLCVWGGGIR